MIRNTALSSAPFHFRITLYHGTRHCTIQCTIHSHYVIILLLKQDRDIQRRKQMGTSEKEKKEQEEGEEGDLHFLRIYSQPEFLLSKTQLQKVKDLTPSSLRSATELKSCFLLPPKIHMGYRCGCSRTRVRFIVSTPELQYGLPIDGALLRTREDALDKYVCVGAGNFHMGIGSHAFLVLKMTKYVYYIPI